MGEIQKLVFFEKGVETLGYFSHEMATAFEQKGYRTFFYDISRRGTDASHLCKFMRTGQTAVITFNFIGLSGEEFLEEPDGRTFWESRQLPVYCILVDHPLYYHKQLSEGISNLTVFCIDREHVAYMKRFYPNTPCFFLPLAGNLPMPEADAHKVKELWIPMEKREYDVAFVANYVALPDIKEHFTSLTQEYIDFYYEILRYFRTHPSEGLDLVFEKFVNREIPEATDPELASAFAGMLFLDLYNRTYYRGKTVQQLVDSGIRVHVFGKGWEKLAVEKTENLIQNGREIQSADCVHALGNAKIALNTMPWFKDGAHDRIFTAMLNGAVSLTDSSRYLRERFTDGKELKFYELDELAQLPAIVEDLLSNPETMCRIAEEGFQQAVIHDTWAQRAETLEKYFYKQS